MGFKMVVAVKNAVVSPVSWSILGLKREPFVVFWVERKIFSGQSNSPHTCIFQIVHRSLAKWVPTSEIVLARCSSLVVFSCFTDLKSDEICTVRNAIIIYKKYFLLKIFFKPIPFAHKTDANFKLSPRTYFFVVLILVMFATAAERME